MFERYMIIPPHILFESTIPSFTNPRTLLRWMGKNIEYGWLDKSYKRHKGFDDWWKHYSLLLPEEVYKYKIGTCYDQTIFEHFIFSRDFPELETKMIWIQQYKISSHSFLVYKIPDSGKWNWFENSFYKVRGIHGPYPSIQNIVDDVHKAMNMHRSNDTQDIPDTGFKWTIMDPKKFQRKLSAPQFYKVVGFDWSKSE